MEKIKHNTDFFFKSSIETHTEAVSADVWENIEPHLKQKHLKEKENSAMDITTPMLAAGSSVINWNNKRFKKIIPEGLKSVWKILRSFTSPVNNNIIEKPSSNERIQKLDDTDKLFMDAAANYPLHVDSAWEKLSAKLSDQCACIVIENKPIEFFSSNIALDEEPSKKECLHSGEIKLMPSTFKNVNYWKRYPLHTSPEAIERCISFEVFHSEGKPFELLRFFKGLSADNVLISPGIGEHAFVFAELAFLIYRKGYNVFILPKHGAVPFSKLIRRHEDAVLHIKAKYAGDLHLYGKGLGGFAVLHLALSESLELKTIMCENAPALLKRDFFKETMNNHEAAGNRNFLLLPLFKSLVKFLPWLTIPVKPYVGWEKLMGFSNGDSWKIERQLIKAYDEDPDFDRHYPLKSLMSAVNAPLPRDISFLNIPVMFILAKTGMAPEYFERLFKEIVIKNKRLEKLEGGFFWMVSNPEEAAQLITSWITQQKNQFKHGEPQT